MAPSRSLALLLVLGALACSADAGAFTYVVQKGDTLASIAERFYGRIQEERLLVAANVLDAQGGTPIVPGMRLEVPALAHRRVKRGDTWASLAETLLGSRHRADVLAIANDTSPWLPPQDGLSIVVPYNLRVVCTQADTIINIAYRFMGDMNKAWILDHYNGLGGKPLQPGDVVLVPLGNLVLTEEGKQRARESAAVRHSEGEDAAHDEQRKIERELPALLADVKSARYVDAVTRGNRFLASGSLSTAQLATIHRQLLEAYVALEARGLATASCIEWRRNDRTARIDPITLSPKIVAACERTG